MPASRCRIYQRGAIAGGAYGDLLVFTPESVKEQIEIVKELVAGNNGSEFKWAEQPEDRTQLWAAKHEAFYANRGYNLAIIC